MRGEGRLIALREVGRLEVRLGLDEGQPVLVRGDSCRAWADGVHRMVGSHSWALLATERLCRCGRHELADLDEVLERRRGRP